MDSSQPRERPGTSGAVDAAETPRQLIDHVRAWLATARTYVDRSILTQVRLLTAIALALLGVLIVAVARGEIATGWAAVGLGAGGLVGVIASRSKRLEWDEQASRVVAHFDLIGAVILAGFIALMVTRDWVLGHWVAGPALAALGLSISAGVLAGRAAGTRRRARKVLESEGVRLPERPAGDT